MQKNMSDEVKLYLDIVDQGVYDSISGCHAKIEAAANEFLADKGSLPVSANDKQGTYTSSTGYFLETLNYHKDPWVQSFLTRVIVTTQDTLDAVDAGCAFGITGLCMAMAGKHVTFHDFEGLGLAFIRWFGQREGLPIQVVPYGEYIRKHSMVVAFDVLEHTQGKHLAFLRWLRDLGHLVVLTYPCRVGRVPPFEPEGLDEWVDDEAIMTVIQHRHQMFYAKKQYDWRSIVFG